MKFSEAMLKGYKQVRGRQVTGTMIVRSRRKPVACCSLGAVQLGGCEDIDDFNDLMVKAWGRSVVTLNDIDQLPWEHIYGMAVVADL